MFDWKMVGNVGRNVVNILKRSNVRIWMRLSDSFVLITVKGSSDYFTRHCLQHVPWTLKSCWTIHSWSCVNRNIFTLDTAVKNFDLLLPRPWHGNKRVRVKYGQHTSSLWLRITWVPCTRSIFGINRVRNRQFSFTNDRETVWSLVWSMYVFNHRHICHKCCSILLLIFPADITVHGKSGRPIVARFKYSSTIWAHTRQSAPWFFQVIWVVLEDRLCKTRSSTGGKIHLLSTYCSAKSFMSKLEARSSFPPCWDYVERWKIVSEFCSFPTRMRESDADLFWWACLSAHKNAFHGGVGLSHLLRVHFCFQVSVPGSFDLQEPPWHVPESMMCNVYNCNRHLFFFGLFWFTLFRTGRSFLPLWVGERTILSHLTFYLSCSGCNAEDDDKHTIDHDSTFLFCCRKHGRRSSFPHWAFLCFSDELAFLQSVQIGTGFSVDVVCTALSLPGHVQMNTFRLFWWSVSLVVVNFLEQLGLDFSVSGSIVASPCLHSKYTWSINDVGSSRSFFFEMFPQAFHVCASFQHYVNHSRKQMRQMVASCARLPSCARKDNPMPALIPINAQISLPQKCLSQRKPSDGWPRNSSQEDQQDFESYPAKQFGLWLGWILILTVCFFWLGELGLSKRSYPANTGAPIQRNGDHISGEALLHRISAPLFQWSWKGSRDFLWEFSRVLICSWVSEPDVRFILHRSLLFTTWTCHLLEGFTQANTWSYQFRIGEQIENSTLPLKTTVGCKPWLTTPQWLVQQNRAVTVYRNRPGCRHSSQTVSDHDATMDSKIPEINNVSCVIRNTTEVGSGRWVHVCCVCSVCSVFGKTGQGKAGQERADERRGDDRKGKENTVKEQRGRQEDNMGCWTCPSKWYLHAISYEQEFYSYAPAEETQDQFMIPKTSLFRRIVFITF